jgi:peptidoglycan-N-acetylglucosamine deacetylase
MWPDAHRGAVAITFDVDGPTLWTGDDPAAARDAALLSRGRYGVEVGLPAIIELLDAHGLPATFFVVGTVAESHPDAVRRILLAGHEVAAHGHTHRSFVEMDEEERAEELRRVRAVLAARGAEPAGHRVPLWQRPAGVEEALVAAGFRYASDLADALRPYRHEGSGLIELPVSPVLDDAPYMLFDLRDWTGRNTPNDEVASVWQAEIDGTVVRGGLAVLTLHPQLIGRPGRLPLLDDVLGALAARGDIWVASCRDIADHVDAERASAAR